MGTASITASFVQRGNQSRVRKAKFPVTFKCPNGWSIRRDNGCQDRSKPNFAKYLNASGEVVRTQKGKLKMRANEATWTLFNKTGHTVLTELVKIDHSVHLLTGINLPHWIQSGSAEPDKTRRRLLS